MKIALCQLNPTPGDIAGNTNRMKDVVVRLSHQAPDLIVFPELFTYGYPPRDLLENNWFIADGLSAIDDLRSFTGHFPDIGIITGVALPANVSNGRGLFNSAVLLHNGKVLFHQNKSLLPTYDVFDEARYFDSADTISLVAFKDEQLGITICEDAWNSDDMWDHPRYDTDPVKTLAENGATILINISASPFHCGKQQLRLSIVKNHAQRHKLPFIFVNMTGANDELIFDGNSMVFDAQGVLCDILPPFGEEIRIIDTKNPNTQQVMPELDTIGCMHDALVLGIKDYMRKTGFKKALVGLSGGIDSAVTCALAVKAVGSEHVLGVTMPSQYSSEGSVSDSKKLAENLGIQCKTIPIQTIFNTYCTSLQTHFENSKPDVTEENIQARIRGTLLMALSNKFTMLVLSTGNKSEMAVGYCTLYGDMCGGLAVIADLYKTTVYELARFINKEKEVIPQAIIDKEPSAELKPNQRDSDTLPPYEVLDKILTGIIEQNLSSQEIIAQGFDAQSVQWVTQAIAKNEYKRRQAAPGLKTTLKAFGCGRRFPVAAKYSR